MNSKYKFLLWSWFFLSLLFSSIRINAQEKLSFNHITVDDGLTTNNARAFYQDFQGFMWIGTENGLQRYDGYELVTYQKIDGDSNSIGGNFIMSMLEDSDKRLWVGSLDGGLSLYNREKNNFYNYTNDPEDTKSIFGQTISSIYQTSDQILWLTTEQGGMSWINLKTFDPVNPVFNNISLPQHMIQKGHLWVRTMLEADNGKFWLGIHGAGLVLFDPEANRFDQVLVDSLFKQIKIDKRINRIYKDTKDRIWISSWGGGLYMYNHDEKKLLNYRSTDNPISIPNNHTISMIEDSGGNFWIGTDNGLCRMLDFNDQYPKGRFEVYVNDVFNENSISTNAIKPLYEDQKKRLWVGTYFGGVNIYDPDYSRFLTIRHHPLKKNSLPGNNVSAIKEDKKGNFWIGTDNNGLCKLASGNEIIEKYAYEEINLVNSQTGENEYKIKSLEIDNTGMIWVGTWGGGLFQYNPELKKYKHFPYNFPGTLPSESVLSLAADNKNNLWIGTFSGGLACMNIRTHEYSYYKYDINDTNSVGNDKINALLIDKEQSLWVGTEGGGLNLYNKEKDNFKRININQLSRSINVLSIYQCHNGYIWTGSNSKGLLKLDPSTNKVAQYTEEFGLPSNLIQSIIGDQDHYLWVGTNDGISKFTFSESSVINFSKEEGLQSKQFNPNSVLLCQDGMMIFGGVKGMNAFYPRNIHKSKDEPDMVFTRFWIDNAETNTNIKGSPLAENITITDEINLKHNQNSFSVEFASLEFDFSNRSKYMTFLEGFDEVWHRRGTERKVNFTNLNPGEYKLHVRSINKDDFQSNKIKTLSIVIHPAWYQTITFWSFLIVFIIAIVYLIVQLRINFFKTQNVKLEEKVLMRTVQLNEKNDKVLVQNEELSAQKDQIFDQHHALELARNQLTDMNSKLEKLVEERTRKLEKTVAELDRFVYSASHDLSAPLKSVLGLLNIAKMDKDKSRTGEYLDFMESSIHKLEDVIKSLISYSRNTRLEVKEEEINLYDVFNNIIVELAFLPNSKTIQFKNQISPTDTFVTDIQRFKVVFHNLINNSIKYADLEKTNPFVDISLKKTNKKLIINIKDNGIGIEEKHQKKIFSMFFRATEMSTGSGLGLFIVKESLSAIGGKIKVSSVPMKETTFSVLFPLSKTS